jgi:ABC-2 type transport system permease protein
MLRNIYLIFRRDYLSYVRAWGFWLGLASLPLFMLIGAGMAAAVSNASPQRYFAVVETDGHVSKAIAAKFARDAEAIAELADETLAAAGVPGGVSGSGQEAARAPVPSSRFTEVPAPAPDIEALRPYLLGEKLVSGPEGEKPLFAVFITKPGTRDVEYWSADVTIGDLRMTAETALRNAGRIEALSAAGLPRDFLDKTDDAAPAVLERRVRELSAAGVESSEVSLADRMPRFVSMGLSYLLWLMIFSVIQYLLMGTIEERGNKIFDALLTSVRVPELLTGKLLAVFGVTSTMMAVWGSFFVVAVIVAASAVPEFAAALGTLRDALLDPKMFLTALVCFVLGYVLYGSVFLALGALCDTIQEAQTVLSPIMILLMLPMFAIVIAFNDPASPVIEMASWVPLFTPFLLILRMPYDPPLWEILLQIGLMALTTLIVVWFATKVYRAGAVNGATAGSAMAGLKRMFGGKAKASTAK